MESKIKINKVRAKPVIKTPNEFMSISEVEKQEEFFELPQNSLKIKIKNILSDKKKLYFTIIPIILLILLFAASIYLWTQLSDIKNDPLKAAQVETNRIVSIVGKLMVLPNGEMPKIATLTDADLVKAKTQSFFVNAKAGDKVLVYSVARKVILYSPQINKIIEVANLDATSGGQSNPTSTK